MTDLAALQELKEIRSLAEKQLKATLENNILLSQLIQALAEEEGIDEPQIDNEIGYLNSRA